MEREKLAKMSVVDFSMWLRDNGVQDCYCELFEENEIDGEAFCELSENDVKAIVKPLGVVKKIIRLQKTTIQPVSEVAMVVSPPLTLCSSSSSSASVPSTSSSCDLEAISLTPENSATSVIVRKEFSIPTKWKPSIMYAISEKKLCPEVRNEIVRDLVTHIYGHEEKPNISLATSAAKLLVAKYPFMADSTTSSGSSSYGSWVKKIMDRVYNVEKSRKRAAADAVDDTTPKKRGRPKRVISLASRYPSIQQHGNISSQQQQHVQAISKEMEKDKPRKDVLLPLMKSTFVVRRQFILESDSSVLSKLEKFPALKIPSLLEQELELILGKQGLQRSFNTEWSQKWVPAIIQYSKGLKRKDIKDMLKDMEKGDDDQKGVLKLLFQLLCVQVKKGEGDMRYLFSEYEMSENPEAVAASPPLRTAPWIGEFQVEDGESMYFIFVEQKVFCSVNSFTKSLFVWFSLFYVFNLEYDKNTKDVSLFFQELVFGLPSNGCKKTSTYLSVTTDIQSYAIH